MEIAAFILSILSLLMSGTVLVIYLAKHVFSKHVVQMVPVDPFAGMAAPKAPGAEFTEFDEPSVMDAAIEEKLNEI